MMLIDEATFGNAKTVDEEATAGVKMFPARKDVLGGLVSHFVVFCISITYLLPQEHLIS